MLNNKLMEKSLNAIESRNSVLRAAINKRNVCPGYGGLFIWRYTPPRKTEHTDRNWRLTLSRFILGFGDRLSDHL
ncbi:hypothetical protein C8D90_105248 [Enterobacillus tribolii]|uniref:Uncharacterized protein n=1 Tax=Enterobacillus tribolii TaxID=1487935 RepID=A0A370QQC0_9GAMM|nr:hypothetical protein C8D90_105248 [Enterobacillus tribolii]